MTTMEEFAFIAAQLEWLEARLRKAPIEAEPGRLDGVLNALTCAQVVMVELAHIGTEPRQREPADSL